MQWKSIYLVGTEWYIYEEQEVTTILVATVTQLCFFVC